MEPSTHSVCVNCHVIAPTEQLDGFAHVIAKTMKRLAPHQQRAQPQAANDDPPPGKKRKSMP